MRILAGAIISMLLEFLVIGEVCVTDNASRRARFFAIQVQLKTELVCCLEVTKVTRQRPVIGVDRFSVLLQFVTCKQIFITNITLELVIFLFVSKSDMPSQIRPVGVGLVAKLTLVVSLLEMEGLPVVIQQLLITKAFGAQIARKRFLVSVDFHMSGQIA